MIALYTDSGVTCFDRCRRTVTINPPLRWPPGVKAAFILAVLMYHPRAPATAREPLWAANWRIIAVSTSQDGKCARPDCAFAETDNGRAALLPYAFSAIGSPRASGRQLQTCRD